ncbi:hypothetical protein T439DRAFT_81628 [Meredithblackwellia eburnea MCA 4105]
MTQIPPPALRDASPAGSSSGSTTPPLLPRVTAPLQASPGSQRTAAISLLRRAASTRESPSTSPNPPATATFPTTSSDSYSPQSSRQPSPLPAYLASVASGQNPSTVPTSTGHRHTTSEDSTLTLTGAAGNQHTTHIPSGPASLERTASLLARSIAMAKLTGEAPPTPPKGYFPFPLPRHGSEAGLPLNQMPSLGDLRERVKLKRNHTVTGVGGSGVRVDADAGLRNGTGNENGNGHAVSGGSGDDDEEGGTKERTQARVNLMRKLSSRRLESPAAKDSLEARDRMRAAARAAAVAAVSASGGAGEGTAFESEPVVGRLGVVGGVGRARPRSGSLGDWIPPKGDWTGSQGRFLLDPVEVGSPLALSFTAQTNEMEYLHQESDGHPVQPQFNHQSTSDDRSETPFSSRSSGNWTEERDRQSVLARMTGESAWEFDGHDGRSRNGHASEDGRYQEQEVIRDSHQLNGNGYAVGSIDQDVDEGEHDRSVATIKSPVVSPPDEENNISQGEDDDERRESASSDFTSISQRHPSSSGSASPPVSPRGPGGLGVDLGQTPQLRRGSIPQHLLGSFSQENTNRRQPASFGIGAVEDTEVRRRGSSASSSIANLLDARGGRNRLDSTFGEGRMELGKPPMHPHLGSDETVLRMTDLTTPVEKPKPRPLGEKQAVVYSNDDEEWTLKDRRMAAKVERKRESGLARAKDGAFPPPEEGYTFPSPPMASSSPTMGGEPVHSPVAPPPQHSNGSLERPKSPPIPFGRKSPSLGSRRAESPLFTPSYTPLSIPEALGGTPLAFSEPLSPTTVTPPTGGLPPIPSHAPFPVGMGLTGVAAAAMGRSSSRDSNRQQNPSPFHVLINGHAKGHAKSSSISTEMARQPSGGSLRSTIVAPSPQVGSTSKMESLAVEDDGPDSNYSSSTEMKRGDSASSAGSLLFEPERRIERLPADQLPSSKILARLDSILGTEELDSSAPTVLDHPPRKLLLHTPVLQVVNANTVKDRHLFLFSDLLVIAKPIIDDHPLTGQPIPSNLDSSFIVKSIVELKDLKLAVTEEQPEESGPRKRHPALVTFVDRFANDPTRAIAALIQRGNLVNDANTIANLLFRNPDLNRNQAGTYLADQRNRHILKAYIDRFRFAGVRIDDALRIFLMSIRLPHTLEAAEYVLGVVALAWAETNGASGFDPSLTLSLVLAIMRLSDALHAGGHQADDGLFSFPNTAISVDDFIAAFREHDPRLLVPESLLTSVYSSVRKERIEQASDNSMFSMTPDIEATIEPGRLPSHLTYRVPSETFTITIPEPDAKFSIKLHGNDLKFEPPFLNFAKSKTQSFRVTAGALGHRAMVLIKLGANAPRYQGLPLTKTFLIERAFMQHTFHISFVNHLDVKRKYMFSTLDADVRATWIQAMRDQALACVQLPPQPTRALAAGEAVAVQVLRDALIAPEPPTVSTAAPSPRPNTAAPRFGPPSTPTAPTRIGRLGTPTKTGAGPGALVRSNSFSRMYAAGVGKVEADLIERDRKQSTTPANVPQPRRGSRDDAAPNPFTKTGNEMVMITEQNSLLPLVLSFLSLGTPVAPHPVSTQGTAFQLPPLPPSTQLA